MEVYFSFCIANDAKLLTAITHLLTQWRDIMTLKSVDDLTTLLVLHVNGYSGLSQTQGS